ncbi:hypothetical protein AGMMS49921_02960 [Endomicrobiia bacterium]|nr:hypothetical protein AGMMS49921_02960 [Endomicrobiia bacterium]
MIKVCYIITNLELDGAQKEALYTFENINQDIFDSFLVTSTGEILNSEAAKK